MVRAILHLPAGHHHHRPSERGAGYGHYEASSAILAREAFDLAGDPTALPGAIAARPGGVEAGKRLLFNGSSTWWKKDYRRDSAKTDADWYTVDVGG